MGTTGVVMHAVELGRWDVLVAGMYVAIAIWLWLAGRG